MKTFLSTALALLAGGIVFGTPAHAGRPTGNTITNPGTPVNPPIPRPSQQVAGQNSGVLSASTPPRVTSTVVNTTVNVPSTDPQ